MKLIYVAGPFRANTSWGIAENVRAAERVGYEIVLVGGMPVIPHANSQHFHGIGTEQFWVGGTMELMKRCDAVVLVEGWERSQGAVAERLEALALDLPVFAHIRELARWIEMTLLEVEAKAVKAGRVETVTDCLECPFVGDCPEALDDLGPIPEDCPLHSSPTLVMLHPEGAP